MPSPIAEGALDGLMSGWCFQRPRTQAPAGCADQAR